MSAQTIHFSYGSNIWKDQMKARCPSSRFIGVARLPGWRWIIHTYGYANLVASPPDHVYGFLYELSPEDERILDTYEGVPRDYHKEILPVEIIKRAGEVLKDRDTIDALIYIDSETVEDGNIRQEYISRLNLASKDGVQEGIPNEYFKKYWQRFVPPEDADLDGDKKLVVDFSFGSNLWKKQMQERCPNSRWRGVGLLRDWRWFINARGYANIIPSKGDHVYGFLYELDAEDEAVLDRYEGVPNSYEKQVHRVEIINGEARGQLVAGKRFLDVSVYVDVLRLENGTIKEEYIHRMNLAIEDALKEGIPKEYIEKYFRPFLEYGLKYYSKTK
ncbi:hypothetical protein K435DRAFT_832371 [Dendrothele bispora CBS 962.96]|uniref:gamma-glutamylcyclotransferase n=1 Tax=Dendrothele bispora (strain CBS 962.96) TaxID=1314807 RepID=A0A4V6T4W9_DENBC|nr:hypothetical protein K435DRAFT_832371 [Dendrothele bispora CBS 962.96]